MILEKFINIDQLQELQNCFSLSTGLAAVTVDYKGTPLLEQSGFTKFCKEARKIDYYKEKCFHCDAYSSMEAARTGETKIYYCHAGLVDFSVPIIIDGAFLGAVMCGQVKVKDCSEEITSLVAKDDYILDKHPNLKKHYLEIEEVSYSRLYESTKLLSKNLQLLINETSLTKVNIELQTLYKKSLQDSVNLSQLYTNSYKSKSMKNFFLSALNLIHKQSYLEDVNKVEEVILATSKLYRYYLKDYKNLVSIQKELNYLNNYIYIQNLRFGELFNIKIDIENELLRYRIPHLLILFLIEISFTYSIEPKEYLGSIHVSITSSHNKINIILDDDGLGINDKEMLELNDVNYFQVSESTTEYNGFFDIYARLLNFFKDDFSLSFSSNEKTGLKISLTIPAIVEKDFKTL